jgi:hypothetical protein
VGDGLTACCGIRVISVGHGIGCDILIRVPGCTSSSNNKSVSSSTRRRAAAAAAAVAASRASRWRDKGGQPATESLILATAAPGRERNPCSEPLAMTAAMGERGGGWRIGAHLVSERRRWRLASSSSFPGSGSAARRPTAHEVRPGDSSAAAAEGFDEEWMDS